jgi:CubicO group peptidase (beta-lactamase class C family)
MDHGKLIGSLDASLVAHAFSGVVSIRHQGQALNERAAGYADRSNKIANSLDTRFGIASGTKFFTVLAIGKLIAAQKLSLSTRRKTVSPSTSHNIRPRSLFVTCSRTLPESRNILMKRRLWTLTITSSAAPWYELRGPRDYLAVFPDEPMKFSPGTRFSYSK